MERWRRFVGCSDPHNTTPMGIPWKRRAERDGMVTMDRLPMPEPGRYHASGCSAVPVMLPP